jgi:NAD(P)-dependent dehydrogenase (short-subunit alcohol dehydrogenase family)
MTDEFAGARVLVTAAAAGVGRCIAERFHERGAAVFAADVDAEGLASLPEGIRSQCTDVASEGDVDALFDTALAQLGGLDVLVNVAGTAGPTATVEDSVPADWRACLDVNLVGTYLCMRRALAVMKPRGAGAIVNFSSTAGRFGYPQRSPYCASKWAVEGLTRAAAAEAGPAGVRVNAIAPGAVSGERMDRVIAAEAQAKGVPEDEVRAGYVDLNSLRTWITAEDLADTTLFLCSAAGAKISGQSIAVDGYTQGL